MVPYKIAIIIPTLNEAKYVPHTISELLDKAASPDELEILVIDAGSSDGTLQSIKSLKTKSFSKPEFIFKKYESLNFGIREAKADSLLFLDADTILPKHFDRLIEDKLRDSKVVGGAFEFSFTRTDWKLAMLQVINRIRYRLGKMYYGDQAIFCRMSVAEKIGGFPAKELMESAYFCRALRNEGRMVLIKEPVRTSPRRFDQLGFFRTFWFDFMMWLLFILNIPVSRYGRKYWGFNIKAE